MKSFMLKYYTALAKRIAFEQDGKPYWTKDKHGNNLDVPKLAGSLHKSGRRALSITVQGSTKLIYAHQVSWFISKSCIPIMLDHKNQDQDFNLVSNLRETNHSTNGQNRGATKNNKLGIKGVQQSEGGFRASICVLGKQYKKRFKTLEAAVQWRKEQAELMHPFRPEEKGSVEDMVRDALTDERFYE